MNILNKYWGLHEKLGIQASKKGYELGRKTRGFFSNKIKNIIIIIFDFLSFVLLIRVCLIVEFLSLLAKIFFIAAISNLFIILLSRIFIIMKANFNAEL